MTEDKTRELWIEFATDCLMKDHEAVREGTRRFLELLALEPEQFGAIAARIESLLSDMIEYVPGKEFDRTTVRNYVERLS